jgi:cellobiose phosphorylase
MGHVLDIGTILVCTIREYGVVFDLSTATVTKFKIHRPDGSMLIVTALFLTTGVDGKLRYVTVANDFNMDGEYQIQAYIEMPLGKWHTDIASFVVDENLI